VVYAREQNVYVLKIVFFWKLFDFSKFFSETGILCFHDYIHGRYLFVCILASRIREGTKRRAQDNVGAGEKEEVVSVVMFVSNLVAHLKTLI